MSDQSRKFSEGGDLLLAVEQAVQKVISLDAYLIRKTIYEPALSFRLGLYLANTFEPAYNVDCEFNRDLDDPKRRIEDGKSSGQRPDVIVHRRGTHDSNLVVVEVKKGFHLKVSESERGNIEAWMGGSRAYRLGVRVAFGIIAGDVVAEIQAKVPGESWSSPKSIQGPK